MDVDALTLSALRAELGDSLLGGRVQRTVQPSQLSLGLEIYTGERHQLLLSAESHAAGPLLMNAKARRGTESPSSLLLLTRKHLPGARLVSIDQPPFERVLRFGFATLAGRMDLICEAMGRLSNIVFVDGEGNVMDAAKRVPASINRYRTILPHHPYVSPPPQRKEQPLSLSTESLSAGLSGQDGPLWRRLIATVGGIGPQLAREIAFRTTGSVDTTYPLEDGATDDLLKVLLELMLRSGQEGWLPHVGYADPEGQPSAFAAYEPTQFPRRERAPSMSDAIRQVWDARSSYDAYAQVRTRLGKIIDAEVARQRSRLAALGRVRASQRELELLQVTGNAVLAMSWTIAPGQTELCVDPVELGLVSEWPEGSLCIALDPSLSPAENAQALFRRYRKAQRAEKQVPQLLGQAELELRYLEQLHADVRLAENRAELDEVERELQEAGCLLNRKKGSSVPLSSPLRLRTDGGDLILVGRNSRQNQQVTFRDAGAGDLWLHAHAVPGGHVIVKYQGTECAAETLLKAAQLAAHYSAARDDSQVQVDYAERRHVRAIKGGRPGMVTYANERTLTVSPCSEDDMQ